jgi:hypothetical protein
MTERQDIEMLKGFMESRRQLTKNPGNEGKKVVKKGKLIALTI